MVRGTAYLITNDKKILYSTQFNGGMSPEDFGREFLKKLNKVKSEEAFEHFISEFNENYFNYKNEQLVFVETGFDTDGVSQAIDWPKMTVTMTEANYSELFFDNWTFWKNISNEIVKIKTIDRRILILKPGQSIAIKFGDSKYHYRPDTLLLI